MSAETMKMPEPIIEPTTIIVESKRPRPLTSSGEEEGGAAEAAGLAVTVGSAIAFASAGFSFGAAGCDLRAHGNGEKFTGARSRVARFENVANHGDGICASGKDFGRAFKGDAADGDNGFAGELAG